MDRVTGTERQGQRDSNGGMGREGQKWSWRDKNRSRRTSVEGRGKMTKKQGLVPVRDQRQTWDRGRWAGTGTGARGEGQT